LYELARRLEGTGVTVNALHPGFVATDLARNTNRTIMSFAYYFAKSSEDGARTQVKLAADPTLENVTGTFWQDSKQSSSNSYSHDTKIQKKLWDVSLEMVGLKEDPTEKK